MELGIFVCKKSKTICYIVVLAICIAVWLSTVVNAAFSSGRFLGDGYITYSGNYYDGSGAHNITNYLLPQGGGPNFSASGVYESPLGDPVEYGLAAGGIYNSHLVGYEVSQFSFSLGGGVVKPSPTTYAFDESIHLRAAGRYFATNNYFPTQYDVEHELIYGEYHINLSGTVAPGMVLGILVSSTNNFVGTGNRSYTFNEGPFEVHLNDISPGEQSVFRPSVDGEVIMEATLSREYTTDFDRDVESSVTVSASIGQPQSSPYPPGDYDRDTDVDANDYAVWRQNFGQSSGSALAADGDFSGVVDAGDYVVWRKGLSAGGSGTSIESATVPEPSTLLLLGIGAISLLGYRKAKSHR